MLLEAPGKKKIGWHLGSAYLCNVSFDQKNARSQKKKKAAFFGDEKLQHARMYPDDYLKHFVQKKRLGTIVPAPSQKCGFLKKGSPISITLGATN